MNRWRVGEDRGSKETDRCPLTVLKRKHGERVEDDATAQACTSVNANVIGPIYAGTSLSAWHTQAVDVWVEGVMGTLPAPDLSTQLNTTYTVHTRHTCTQSSQYHDLTSLNASRRMSAWHG
jgi:hypothetical protein